MSAKRSEADKSEAKQSEAITISGNSSGTTRSSPKLTSAEAAILAASREAAKCTIAKELYAAEQRYIKFLKEADNAETIEERSIAESKAIQWFRAYQDATSKLLKASGQIKAAEMSAAKEAETEDTQTIKIVWVGWDNDGN